MKQKLNTKIKQEHSLYIPYNHLKPTNRPQLSFLNWQKWTSITFVGIKNMASLECREILKIKLKIYLRSGDAHT